MSSLSPQSDGSRVLSPSKLTFNEDNNDCLELSQCLTMSNEPGLCIIDTSDGFADGVLYAYGNYLLHWIPQTQQQSIKIKHSARITALAYNRESRLAASADRHHETPKILLWEMETYDTLFEIDLHGIVSALDFSHDGKFLAAIETSRTDGYQRVCLSAVFDCKDFFLRQVLLWDLLNMEDTEPSFAALLPSEDIHDCLKFSNVDNNRLISNGRKTVYFWTYDLNNPDSLTYSVPEAAKKDERFTCSTFMPNGLDAISGTAAGNLVLWKPESISEEHDQSSSEKDFTYTAVKTLNSHSDKISLLVSESIPADFVVKSLFDSRAGDVLIAGSKGGALSFLDGDLKLRAWMDGFGEGFIRSISFSRFNQRVSVSDRDFVVVVDGEIYRSSSANSEEKRSVWKPKWLQHISRLALHPRRPLVASIDSSNRIVLFSLDNLTEVCSKQLSCKGSLSCIAYFRDGKQICVGTAAGEILLLSNENLEVYAELRNCRTQIVRLTANASGEYLAAMNEKEEVLLYSSVGSSQGVKRWEYRGKQVAGSTPRVKSIDFYDTPNGQSVLLELVESGDILEVNLENSNLVSGILTKPLLHRPIKNTSFCFAPPGRYFDQASSETDIVIAGLNGKLHVENINTASHVYTYLSPLGTTPIHQFGFFEEACETPRPLMWYASQEGHLGICHWPPSNPSTSGNQQINLEEEIQNAFVCHDAKRLLLQTTSGISIWKINPLCQDQNLSSPDHLCIKEDALSTVSKFFRVFQSINAEADDTVCQDCITADQMEALMCRLGFYPSPEEVEDMVSECRTQAARKSDQEWSGQITKDCFLSLFARYSRAEDFNDLAQCFKTLVNGQEEISREDFLWKLDSAALPLQKEIENSVQKTFKRNPNQDSTIIPLADYLDLEGFLLWIKTNQQDLNKQTTSL